MTTLLAGWYFKIARSLPLLRMHISKNDPIIYADTVKPYHIEQLNSLPLSFNIGGIIGVAISSLKRLWPRLTLIAAALVLSGYSLLHIEEWSVKDDWRSAAKVAKEHVQPGDMILLDHLFGKKPFNYYGLQTVKPLKRTEAEGFLETAPQDVWLLVSYQSKWSVRDLLDERFDRIQEWSFPGSTDVDDLPTIDGKIHLIHYREKTANAMAGSQRAESVAEKLVGEEKPGTSSAPFHHRPMANATSGGKAISH